ncbi:maltokinase N-terminal cap-like domain-containing protein [Thermomonospora umbrina]|uniref:Maltokinase n=1 Tax=Thermomonospora umbrina TaxID=111806 RepID=A0A3D9SWP0_9ACTN|nr:phosphotransferase [Thermomonospora umbrina]REE98930.1 maltokinase [Thermomonospora umbrina]
MRPPDRSIEQALIGWLPRRRWFAGKGREVTGVEIVVGTDLSAPAPEGLALRHTLVRVRQDDGASDLYQLLLGYRNRLPDRLQYAEILAVDGMHVYDAAHDPDLTQVLLADLASEASVGPLSFHRVPGAEVETGLASLAGTAEQSNTSLVFGEDYIYKLFRRITPGVNPDLELNLALTNAGCAHIPRLYGWVDMRIEEDAEERHATVGMLSEFLRTASDGWQLATTSVRDLYGSAELHAEEAGGDFSAEARRLGTATATVHRDLADAFGVRDAPADVLRAASARMHEQLEAACTDVPELAPYAASIRAVYADLAELDRPVPVQRIHGDYHLGQVMRTDRGWVLLDFEGEPARTLAERQAPAHPLRDVAGMLRSFEYAARFLLAGHKEVAAGQSELLEARAREWADRNRSAFCRGYADGGGPDPGAHALLLRAFELDKAVYEVLYEARNRPSWLHVPLGSLPHLTT